MYVCNVYACVATSGLRQAKACMLKLASHRRWFDTIVIYVLQTLQFHLNDSIKRSVCSAVDEGVNSDTVNLDCVILARVKKDVNSRAIFFQFSFLSFVVPATSVFRYR